MYSLSEALDIINDIRAKILKAEALREEIRNSKLPQGQRDEEDRNQEQQITRFRRYQEDVLRDLARFPVHKIAYFQNLQQFHSKYTFEKSVFIMTKFPGNNGSTADIQLGRVIKAVRGAVDAYGYHSHLASDRDWSQMLWENVETYLLACSRGIAIVESKHSHELNPNVTMEWGWMRSTDRKVLFLVEKTFDMSRADLSGLTRAEFEWDDPEAGIDAAVQKFLKD
jgi:hypothetical protein